MASGASAARWPRSTSLVGALEERVGLVRQLRLSVMDFCDPFDPTVLPVLRELLEGLQDRLPGQVVLMTSRLHPGPKWLDWLMSLSLRVSVFVSLGDATGRVSPVTPVAPRLQLLQDCRDRSLHSVMLLRPLVCEWTEPAALRRLLASAEDCCDEVVLSGLQLSPPVEGALTQAGWPVPAIPAGDNGGLAPEFRASVRALAAAVVRGVPVSEHRSCAINRRLRLRCVVTRQARPGAGPGASALCVMACCGPDVTAGAPVRLDGYCRLKVAA
ncbi:MAG: hypothetical protein QM765_37425 [Myxococcales bacterium]